MRTPSTASPAVVLTTLNAKYIHASLGLRYLLANLGELRESTALREFTIARPVGEIVDDLLSTLDELNAASGREGALQIVGFGVYIWNVVQTTAVVRTLRAARPHVRIVLGGPEVSHETDGQEIVALADHIITGWGEASFPRLCRALIDGCRPPRIIAGEQLPLTEIVLPYREYTDADLAHRLLYVEASRGCPFRCEFCLSALDKTAWSFDLDRFLAEMQRLYERCARNFKFVDRTFNLKVDDSVRILHFFLDRLASSDDPADRLFVHFEVIPDHLPERLRQLIAQFPAGSLQLEVGIQSFNEVVQQRISRRQDNARSEANLRWLLECSQAHVHADLIFGLPGETLASFAEGFDRLYRLRPHEIQLGLLKRLRGTPIDRHTVEYGMVYDELPPYTVQQTTEVDAPSVRRFTRFARYWEMIANSGRFSRTLPLLLDENDDDRRVSSPFASFMDFSDWLWGRAQRTNGLSPESLVDALFDHLVAHGMPAERVRNALIADYVASGARGNPQALTGRLPKREMPVRREKARALRQDQHLAGRLAEPVGLTDSAEV